ncbi:MAG: hypothetical protein R3247_10805, partial [Rhodothermales bacterium]|nr:hypothetical protein [Rhodothermales bacterium]
EPLDRLRQQRALNALLDRMLNRFSELAAALPATYEVVSREALPEPGSGVVPGSVPIQEAPFRETARRFLETRATRNLAEANETLLRETAAVLDGLYAVDQQVRFNLQAALDELEADEPDAARAATLATEALQRACAHLGRLRTRSEAFAGAVHEQVAAATRGLVDPLEEEIAGRTGTAARLQREPRAALSRGASALARARHFVRARYGVLRRWLGLWLRPFAREVRREMRASRGLDELEPAEVLQRRDQAALSSALTERLPFIYQKLFALAPLDADDFLVGRAAQAETVALALRRWQAGVACSVAVVAEPGGGASSFLGRIRRSLPDEPPVAALRFAYGLPTEEALAKRIGAALGVPQLRSLHALRRYLEAGAVAGPQARRFVVLLEDLHHLYQRAPGGFDLLRQLGLLIAATGRQVFWIASAQTHAWRYIDAVTGLSDAFAFTVELPPLDQADLERAIVERHRLSGFNVTFEPAPLTAQRRRYRRADPERQQALARAEYFEQLHRLSGGNPYGALFLWLRSIERVEEDALVIAPLERFSYGYVRRLDPAALMTLRVVFQRGSLTAGEHARLFGLPEAESRTTLAHLAGLNLLAPAAGSNGSSEVFTIHRPAYRPLADELRALNLVE